MNRPLRHEGSRISRSGTLLLFLAGILLYALTYTGRYFHDGALFLRLLEEGRWVWIHLGYLPAAQTLHLLLRPLGFGEAEHALAALSVLSASACLAVLHFWLRALPGPPGSPFLLCLLAAATPAFWIGATQPELHVFSAAGAAAALFLTWRRPLGRLPSTLLAAFLLLVTHLSGAYLLAVLPFLAVRDLAGREAARAWFRIASWTLGCALALLFLLDRTLGAGAFGGKLGFTLDLLGTGLVRGLEDPSILFRALAPFGVLGFTGILALFLPRARGEGAPLPSRAALAAGLLPFLVYLLSVSPEDGQFALPLFPLLVLGTYGIAVPAGRRGRHLLLFLLGLQAVLGLRAEWRSARDPDRLWARAVAARIGPDRTRALVLCRNLNRARRLRKDHGIATLDLPGATIQDPALALDFLDRERRRLEDRGVRVYLDAALLEPSPPATFPLGLLLRRRIRGENRKTPVVRYPAPPLEDH